jgi:thymidine kinase
MPKLYFYYSAMNAGKSTNLIQSAHNYEERGMKVLTLIPSVVGKTRLESRIGLTRDATVFEGDTLDAKLFEGISAVFVDESQFLTKKQVIFLAGVVDTMDIPVLCYGLRTDFKGEPFEGAKYLLSWADEIIEIKTICECSKKATMNIRIDEHLLPMTQGDQVQIGGNESYVSVCRADWFRLTR